jgi:uncharacterized protein (DUF2236 family)
VTEAVMQRVIEARRAEVRGRLRAARIARPGPGSITWKVNRERIVVGGWGRAILLQLAHPSIAAALEDHSSFRGSLFAGFRRMNSTVAAMLAITFGEPEEMIAAATHINMIHDRVRGQVPPARGGAAEVYSAHDPDLQRWVHATLLESIPLTYELLVGPMTPRERDQYCVDATIMEPLLGMPAGSLPRESAQVDAYMNEMLSGGRLVITDTSRALARAVLFPPRWYAAWPAFRALQLLTIGSLPPSIREAYGFEWRPRDARAFARWMTMLKTSLPIVPPLARHWGVARRPLVTPSALQGEHCQ